MGDADDLNLELSQTGQEIHRWFLSGFSENLVVAAVETGEIARLWVGAGAARIYGYSVEEMEEGTDLWLQVLHPADRDRVKTAWERILTSGKPIVEEFRIYRLDGQLRWVRASCTAERDESGNVVRVVGLLADATDEKSAVERLAPFRELLDEAPHGVSVQDTAGHVVYCNKAYARAFGYASPDELLGITLEHVVAPEHRAEFDPSIFPRLLEEPWSGDVAITRDDGSTGQLSISTTPLKGPDGKAVAIYSMVMDVTERKQMEGALRDAEEKQRALIQDANAIIYRLDPNHKPLAITGVVEAITGYSPREILDNPELWSKSVHPDDLSYVMQSVSEIVAKGKPHFLEFRVLRRTGEIVWMRVLVTPRLDEQGNLQYIDGVGFDITERMESRRREAKHTMQMAALAEISRDFATSLDFATIADRAVERIGRALGCISTFVSVDPASGRLRHEAAWARDTQRIAVMVEALARAELTAETSLGEMGLRPRMASDLGMVSPAMRRFAEAAGIAPAIMVPVEGVEGAIHFLTGVRPKGEPEFDEEDLWFLTEVASHASAALINASLYCRQTRIAETLQRSLIPDVPDLDCLEIATCYLPASGEAEIGGDFFDLIPFGRGKVGIVVGDVSGKGIQAAVHTAEAKYMLRGFANLDPDPEHVVTALNEALCVYMAESTFVTLLYAVVDVANHSIDYVNAGHELPILVRCDGGTVQELSQGNTILGIAPGWKFRAESTRIYPDSLLFCYTDGITDVPNNGERFGHERLLDTIRRAPDFRPRELLDSVVGEVRAFGKGKQPDDQVIVVARPVE